MIIESITVASTLLWILLCYLFYRSGHKSGFLAGVARDKETRAQQMRAAQAAGRFEAWKEIADMIEDVNTNADAADDRQVH